MKVVMVGGWFDIFFLFQAHVSNKIPDEAVDLLGAFNKAVAEFVVLLDDIDTIKIKQVSHGGAVHMKAVIDTMKLVWTLDDSSVGSIDQRACESHCEQMKLHAACLPDEEPTKQYYIQLADYISALIPVRFLLQSIA